MISEWRNQTGWRAKEKQIERKCASAWQPLCGVPFELRLEKGLWREQRLLHKGKETCSGPEGRPGGHQKGPRQWSRWWQRSKQGGAWWRWTCCPRQGVEFHFYSVFSSRRGQRSHCSTDRHQYAFAVFIICVQHCICIPGGVGICFFSKLQTLRCWVGNVSSVSQLCSTSVSTLRIQTLPGRPACHDLDFSPSCAHGSPHFNHTDCLSFCSKNAIISYCLFSCKCPARHFFFLLFNIFLS